MMRRPLTTLCIALACCMIGGCAKPVSQRMEGKWTFDKVASSANWDAQNTPPNARSKITALMDTGTFRLGNGKITLSADYANTTIAYEILQDGDHFLVARVESRDARKRADIKVEMRSKDILTLSSDYPVPGATVVLTRSKGNED